MNAKRLIDSLFEGGHKAGCQCGFCKNKGKFGKKKEDGDKSGSDCKDDGCDAPRKAAASTSPKSSGGSKGGSSTNVSMARK
jgi:hypothetical protein